MRRLSYSLPQKKTNRNVVKISYQAFFYDYNCVNLLLRAFYFHQGFPNQTTKPQNLQSGRGE